MYISIASLHRFTCLSVSPRHFSRCKTTPPRPRTPPAPGSSHRRTGAQLHSRLLHTLGGQLGLGPYLAAAEHARHARHRHRIHVTERPRQRCRHSAEQPPFKESYVFGTRRTRGNDTSLQGKLGILGTRRKRGNNKRVRPSSRLELWNVAAPEERNFLPRPGICSR